MMNKPIKLNQHFLFPFQSQFNPLQLIITDSSETFCSQFIDDRPGFHPILECPPSCPAQVKPVQHELLLYPEKVEALTHPLGSVSSGDQQFGLTQIIIQVGLPLILPPSTSPPLSNTRCLSAYSPSAIRFPISHTIRRVAL
jgi:hypothetical protein